MRATLLVSELLGAALTLACASSEETAEQARAEIQQALEHGNRTRALAAIDELRDALPETPEALLEVSRFLVQAGDSPRAGGSSRRPAPLPGARRREDRPRYLR